MTRSRGRAVALAAVTLGLGFSGTALAADADPLRVTAPVQATKEDVDPGRTYTAPNFAVDPSNPKTVVAATIEARSRRCMLLRSVDGGSTWRRLDASPALGTYPFCFVPTNGTTQTPIAFGRNSTLYYGLAGWDTQDGGSRNTLSVLLARSTDLGDSWQTVVVRDARPLTGENTEAARSVASVVVDTESGNDDIVYVSWGRQFTGAVAPNARPSEPTVAVSTNGGRSFSEPINLAPSFFTPDQARQQAISSSSQTTTTAPAPGATTTTTTVPPAGSRAATPNQVANFGGSSPSLTIDDDGTVYAAWQTSFSNITPAPVPAILVSKSTDQGKTWTTTMASPYSSANGGRWQLEWSEEGGDRGTLHLVYQGRPRSEINGEFDIFHRRSTDGGATWSEPKTLNDDPPQQFAGTQVNPNLSVAPNGRVDVAWFDTRDDPGIRSNDVYYTYSTDNGETFAKNVRVTDRTIDRRIGIFANNFDQTAPPGLVSTNEFTLIGWDDTRNAEPGELGAGTQDVYTSQIQFTAVGGGASKTAKIVLAAVAGLLAVGLVLLLVSLAARRRSGPSAPKKSAQPKSPAKVG